MKRIIAREGNRITYEYPSRVTKDPETGMVDAEYNGGTRVVHVVSAEPVAPGTTNAEHTQRVAETAARLATMTAEAAAQKRHDEDAATIAKLRRRLVDAEYALAAQERVAAGLAQEVERLKLWAQGRGPDGELLPAPPFAVDSVFSMPMVPIDPEAEKLVDGLVSEATSGNMRLRVEAGPELRTMAKRMVAQPNPKLDEEEIREWATRLAAEAVPDDDAAGFYRGAQRVVGGVVSGADGCFTVDADPPEADTQRIPRVKSETAHEETRVLLRSRDREIASLRRSLKGAQSNVATLSDALSTARADLAHMAAETERYRGMVEEQDTGEHEVVGELEDRDE